MLTFTEIYHGYGLLIGLTSYRLVNGRYQQSRITQTYAVILNVIFICALPFVFLDVANGLMMTTPWLPGNMFIVPIVFYMVNYAVIVYMLISRSYRDSMLIDLLDLSNHLTRKMEKAGLRPNPQLRRLLHLKRFTFVYINIGSMATMLFLEPLEFLQTLLINLGYSILTLTTYYNFASFWQVARGYDFVNQRFATGRLQGKEIRNLWFLHSRLNCMAHRINRIYGLQMLVCRLDYIISTIVYGFVGIIFLYRGVNLLALHLTLIILVRTVDFFLNDFVFELTLKYQCQPKDEVIEGIMSQELSDFLIYESSSQLNLKVCGLYSANRSQYLQMIGFIISNSTLLVQFYLILKEDTTN